MMCFVVYLFTFLYIRVLLISKLYTMSTQTMTPKKGVKNGKAVTPKATAQTEKATVLKVAKDNPKKLLEKAIKDFIPSAEERIKNAENFQLLTKKYAHLKRKNEDLKKFEISSDGTQENLTLENSQGFEFTVTNSNIIAKVLSLLQSELNTMTEVTEKEVQEFIV